MLARIHAVDYEAVGLGDFGHPDGFLERQLRRWGKQWERVQGATISPQIDELAAPAAARRCPSRGRPRSCTATTGSTTRCWPPTTPDGSSAVLDWEMSTLGDPLADLGLFLLYWGQSEAQIIATGRGDRRASRASSAATRSSSCYAERERARPSTHLDFYVVFAFYKLAIIVEGIHARFRMGKTLGEGFDHMGEMVKTLVRRSARAGRPVVDPRVCTADAAAACPSHVRG